MKMERELAALSAIDKEYLIDFFVNLLNTPSPTGFTEQAITLVESELAGYSQLKLSRTRKDALVLVREGLKHDSSCVVIAQINTLDACHFHC